MTKYDFAQLILDGDLIDIDTYMESMRKEDNIWHWYNEIVSDLELDDYESMSEQELNIKIKAWIFEYIFH